MSGFWMVGDFEKQEMSGKEQQSAAMSNCNTTNSKWQYVNHYTKMGNSNDYLVTMKIIYTYSCLHTTYCLFKFKITTNISQIVVPINQIVQVM